jgi:hypothetical protein
VSILKEADAGGPLTRSGGITGLTPRPATSGEAKYGGVRGV